VTELSAFPLQEALAFLRERITERPEVFLVLGSGLGGLADAISVGVSIPFQEVPGFPGAGVVGHEGRLISGELEGRPVLLQSGRFHYYEGYPSDLVVAPVRLAAALGARTMILSNAAGGIAPGLEPGSIMLLDDHLNLMARSPLEGPVQGEEARFPDMAAPYDPAHQARVLELARRLKIPLSRGVYAAVLGPSYETPAEVRFLERVGAQAVGMSTVPEAATAAALGLRVLGFSLITNRAAGLGGESLSHREVLEVGGESGGRLEVLLRAFLRDLPRQDRRKEGASLQ
jgi:purine-nucleoside phosphorylase